MLRAVSQWLLDLFGWKIVGRYPEGVKKFVIIVMPHTSWWDFPLGALVRAALQADINYIGKKSLFRPPFGWFFRWMGGYPVDRSRRANLVDAVVDIFQERENFVLAIAPEGTRKKVDKLKTGFYYIALGAGVPIIMVKFDYEHREVVISEPFRPSGDKDADFRVIINYFKGVKGKRPGLEIDEKVKY
jgi:1-acyl-sn-glycerol-3-phosphate acyltransferase